MGSRQRPTPGPEATTAYRPGSPGAAWTAEEIDSTRARILQMIHPNGEVKKEMYKDMKRVGRGQAITENVLMRLVFHDCMPYTDGSGGCDGCLNLQDPRNEDTNNMLRPSVAILVLHTIFHIITHYFYISGEIVS